MAKVTIRNVGPISNVELDLNKVNVFMGPQSSGKSTIAKVISYCTWMEKDVATSQSLTYYEENRTHFRDHMESFHKIKGYFRKDSYVSYESDVVVITWDNEQSALKWNDRYAYRRSKISYIPAERNMVILPEARKVEFGETNVRSFLFDWFDARKKYSIENKLPILNLGADYYYVEGNEEDHIKGVYHGNEYDIFLSSASSGLQSVTPLVTMIEYLTKWIYDENSISFVQQEKQRKVGIHLVNEEILKPYFSIDTFTSKKEREEKIEEFNTKLRENNPDARKHLIKFRRLLDNLHKTQNSQFIIEEPEQNLFPETQRDLVYYLLGKCLSKEGNRLTLTTHSPYVLYALNNCMMGGVVYDKMSDRDKNRLKCQSARIKPDDVSVYEIHDGTLKRIQQDDRLLGKNFFDAKMKELMDDFYVMLNYYGK